MNELPRPENPYRRGGAYQHIPTTSEEKSMFDEGFQAAIDAGYVKLPSVEGLEGMVWDASTYHVKGELGTPRSMFIAQWIIDSINQGLYMEEGEPDDWLE